MQLDGCRTFFSWHVHDVEKAYGQTGEQSDGAKPGKVVCGGGRRMFWGVFFYFRIFANNWVLEI